MPRRREGRCGAAARPRDGVQVDIVRHLAGRVIGERELDEIALTNEDEAAWHVASERPEEILHAVRHPLYHLAHFELYENFRRVGAFDGRRHLGRLREHGGFFSDDTGVTALRAGA